jgi:hypothetical protein
MAHNIGYVVLRRWNLFPMAHCQGGIRLQPSGSSLTEQDGGTATPPRKYVEEPIRRPPWTIDPLKSFEQVQGRFYPGSPHGDRRHSRQVRSRMACASHRRCLRKMQDGARDEANRSTEAGTAAAGVALATRSVGSLIGGPGSSGSRSGGGPVFKTNERPYGPLVDSTSTHSRHPPSRIRQECGLKDPYSISRFSPILPLR